jgi:hypothetical protein
MTIKDHQKTQGREGDASRSFLKHERDGVAEQREERSRGQDGRYAQEYSMELKGVAGRNVCAW